MIAVATIFPMVFVLNMSLKDRRSYILDQVGLTDTFHTANFGDAWRRSNLTRYMINSTIVTIGSVAVLLLLGSLAGYAFAQLSFKVSNVAYLACLGALMIPFQVIMVPFLRMMNDINFVNTYWGLILAYTSIFLPFTVYLMASFYRRIPRSITEAATIDGSVGVGYVPADHRADRQAGAALGRHSQRPVRVERRARVALDDARGAEAHVDDRGIGSCAASIRQTSRSSPPAC